MTDLRDEPSADEPIDAELVNPQMTSREAYNVITNTVTGVNVRVSDNVFQAIAIRSSSNEAGDGDFEVGQCRVA